MAEIKQKVRQVTEFIDDEINTFKAFALMCGNRQVATVVKEMYKLIMERPDLQKVILHRHDLKKGTVEDRRKHPRKGA